MAEKLVNKPLATLSPMQPQPATNGGLPWRPWNASHAFGAGIKELW